jgi:hypothetical protein
MAERLVSCHECGEPTPVSRLYYGWCYPCIQWEAGEAEWPEPSREMLANVPEPEDRAFPGQEIET